FLRPWEKPFRKPTVHDTTVAKCSRMVPASFTEQSDINDMATSLDRPVLAPRLRALLRGLRWRIRLYTFIEGLAVLVIWLAAMFWLALLIDYGPVLLGANELPRGARIVMLGIVGIGAAIILYRW